MRFALVALCLSLAACATTARPGRADTSVVYRVTPIFEGDALERLEVELHLRGAASGETRLELPKQWAGAGELWRNVSELRVEGASAVLENNPAERVVRHAPGQALVVRYAVTSPFEMDPGAEYQKAVPIIRPSWFFFHGEGVFVIPQGGEDRPARFEWGRFPKGWSFASDLEHLNGPRPGTVEDVVESAAIAGVDVRVYDRMVAGAPVRLAIRGDDWRFSPEALAKFIGEAFEAQAAFWRDRGRPYLIPVAPLRVDDPGRYSVNGTGRSDAFSVVTTTQIDVSKDRHFLAHELMHTWIARELGGLPRTDEALHYWLSEGFTDFYADRLLLRGGQVSLEEHFDGLNKLLRSYGTNPAKNAPASEIVKAFWTNQALEKLPYQRGALMAIVLDHRLRTEASTSLDDVLRAQLGRVRGDVGGGRPKIPAAERFPIIVREIAGLDVSPFLEAHNERGETVELPPDVFGDCAQLQTVTRPAFHRGFEPVEVGQPIGDVDPDSPAFAAGVRKGMVMVRREAGEIGDAAVEIVYRLRDGATERVFRYLPRGRGSESYQQATLSEAAKGPGRAECTRRIGG